LLCQPIRETDGRIKRRMMTIPRDILLALVAMTLIGLALGCLGAWCGRRRSSGAAIILAALATAVLVIYGVWLTDNLWLARVLPVADVAVWANLQAPAVGLLAGVAWSRMTGRAWQKSVLVGTLVLVGLWRMAGPCIGAVPQLRPGRWHRGICVQTTTSTCSAAAAATLLRMAGIHATEAEMTSLCLTHIDGTTALGLYRGLKIKTAGTRWDVVIFTGRADDLKHQPLPAIVSIRSPGAASGVLGVGNRHSVVVMSFGDAGSIQIGDPFTGGRERWTVEELEPAYVGEGLALVKR
jgi:hypothetical protein